MASSDTSTHVNEKAFEGQLSALVLVEPGEVADRQVLATIPHVKNKSMLCRPFHLPRQPLFLGGSVKVNQKSENHRFGLSMRVGGPSRGASRRWCSSRLARLLTARSFPPSQ